MTSPSVRRAGFELAECPGDREAVAKLRRGPEATLGRLTDASDG